MQCQDLDTQTAIHDMMIWQGDALLHLAASNFLDRFHWIVVKAVAKDWPIRTSGAVVVVWTNELKGFRRLLLCVVQIFRPRLEGHFDRVPDGWFELVPNKERERIGLTFGLARKPILVLFLLRESRCWTSFIIVIGWSTRSAILEGNLFRDKFCNDKIRQDADSFLVADTRL